MKCKNLASAIAAGAILAGTWPAVPGFASSHMDAPLITFDTPANTTDVYAFLSEGEDGVQYLTTALSVYPFEEPGIGPNNYRFDDRVLYEIHVALGDDVAAGQKTISYEFEFQTSFQNQDTIRQAYLGAVEETFGANQNMRQTYTVTKVDHRSGIATVLFEDAMVPPNNQGLVTRFYNQNDDGDMPAKEGVDAEAKLDRYTFDAIEENNDGYRVFAGQRDDGFYADIQSIFDLDFTFGAETGSPEKPFDSQGGFNVHTIALDIPMSVFGGEQLAGVYATTSREQIVDGVPQFVQVGRQGNPLFAEALVANVDKDLYNQSEPTGDETFGTYADNPELSQLLNVDPLIPGLLRAIYIPDLIKVDLTTGPAVLAGQDGFNRLSVFGGDVLLSEFQDPFDNGGFIPGGWPNGRRFGDDVVDIAIIAVGAAGEGPFDGLDVDGVVQNDITYNDVFPYAATPLNGRNHGHHDAAVADGGDGNGGGKGNGNGNGNGKGNGGS